MWLEIENRKRKYSANLSGNGRKRKVRGRKCSTFALANDTGLMGPMGAGQRETGMTCRGMEEVFLAEPWNAEALWLAENKRIAWNPQFRIPQTVNHNTRLKEECLRYE